MYIETRLAAEKLSQEEMEYLGLSLTKGNFYVCEYEADAKTYRVLSSKEYILRADGSREEIGQVTIQVNVARQEYIDQLEARAAAIDALPADQVRVITCIVDPGLETEHSISKKVEKGSYLLFPEDLQGYGIFLDAEGTQPLVSTPELSEATNQTIYLIKEK